MHRKLGFWDVFSIAAGAMISSGLFVLPGIAFSEIGPAIVLSYALAAVFVIPALLCQAELASAVPRAGATYVFIERSLGSFAGVFAGLASWFSIALKSAFALIGIGAFARLIWPQTPQWGIQVVAAGFCLVFATINCLTVKGAGRLQVIMVAVLLAVLVVFVAGGKASGQMEATRFSDFYRAGPLAVLAAAGTVFVSFGGLTATADVAGEVRNPGKVLPAGMFTALVVVGLLYVLVVFITVAVTDPGTLSGSLTPLSDAAGVTLGATGKVLLALAAILAFVTTANGGMMEASRSPVAMSRDGLLPGVLQATSRRFATPYASVLMTAGLMILVIVGLSIENLVKVASTMLLVLYVLICLAVVIMRTSRIQNYRPTFRAPLVPYLPVAGAIVYVFLIADMGWVPLGTAGLFALAGGLWWLLYVRPGVRRESALVYMVKSILSRDLRRSHLEEELKEIAFERDEVQHDRFDKLLLDCGVLDLPEATTGEEMLCRASAKLAQRNNLDEDELRRMFHQREKESPTVLQPGLAVPHVVVQGEGIFDLLLVRCRKGMAFRESEDPVHIAFVLIGSPDQRNFHLRALMAIAHIVQEHDFARRFTQAGDPEQIRDVLLLSKRQRLAHGS
jgi:amino acid transporter/mannitol/fructose-specific phosphotransferase system IIA component (Ntr-type)